jgi:glucose/mannose-6-phosphate isomerase
VSLGSGPHALDRLEDLTQRDSLGVLSVVEGLADQIRDARDAGRSASGLPDGVGIETILILGMGGSGISGDVTRAILQDRLAMPIHVLKSYGPVPAWVGRNTLVVAVSYSGGTEETLAALEEVHARGSRVVAISSGGPLATVAQDYGIAHVAIHPGLQPRASLGYLVMPILAVLEQMGLAPALEDDVNETVATLDELRTECGRAIPHEDNPAKRLAAQIEGRIPIVYGGHGLASLAAYRFKCDLNEYAKTPAFWNEIPEANHNEVEGWSGLDALRERFVAIMLRDHEEHPQIARRFDITKRLIDGSVAEIVDVPSRGVSSLARLFSLIYVTQLAAIYLALAYGRDPGPVEVLTRLKEELAKEA